MVMLNAVSSHTTSSSALRKPTAVELRQYFKHKVEQNRSEPVGPSKDKIKKSTNRPKGKPFFSFFFILS